MDKLRKALSGDDEDAEERGIVGQIYGVGREQYMIYGVGREQYMLADASSLSWSTRIKGFIACFCIGFLLTVLGSISVFFANYTMFGVLYTIGSLTALASSFFLMGPLNQLKKMFAATRLIATIVMLAALVMTLLAAFLWHNGGLVLLFVIIQFLAMTWYSLSYIPYARDAVKKCFEGCIS